MFGRSRAGAGRGPPFRLPAIPARELLRAGRRCYNYHMSNTIQSVPDPHGRFGPYGGRYVPETLMYALRQLSEHYDAARQDPEFQRRLDYYLRHYVGRPSQLYFAERLTKHAGGARIYLKREDLN